MTKFRALLILVFALFSAPDLSTQTAPTPLRIYFFDVGQGDGVLIQSPSGQNVVYDGGDSPTEMRQHLQALGVAQVSLVIASHNHADHIGGLAKVVEAYRPLYYMDNGLPATTQTYLGLLASVRASGSQLLEPTSRRITLGDASLVVVPPPRIAEWDQNDNSVGIILEYGTFRLSLGGDGEPREWAWWLQHYRDLIQQVQVHKASHHGSSNGDTSAGVDRLSPEVVVVSAGKGNSYGHPDQSALALYGKAGATVYRTDLNGTIKIEVQASGAYTIQAEAGEGARPPPATSPPSPTPAPTPAPSPTPTPTTFTLSGIVQNVADFGRLSGVTVRITSGANSNRSTTTDSLGAYSLSTLQSGAFNVEFSKSGYTTATHAVTLTQSSTLSPLLSPLVTAPIAGPRTRIGATCRDGSSSNATGSGACSTHGGVSCWRYSDGTCTNP